MKHERRNYGQYCGLAGALDIVGERWTLLIVRELLITPSRYNELLANLPGIGTNLLADRLKFLTESGVVRQRTREGSKVRMYELTDRGWLLRESVHALTRWGLGVLGAPAPEDTVRSRWAALTVEAMIDPEVTGPAERYEFHVDDEVFHITAGETAAVVTGGPAPGEPALTATTDATTFVEIGAGRLNPLEAALTGRLTMNGTDDAILRCSRLLGLVAARDDHP